MSYWYAQGPNNASDAAFKLNKRTGIYTASNVMFDPKAMTATSFNWWYFVKRIGGKVVFNDYSYSGYTTRHQSKVKRVMQQLGIKVDVVIEARKGLQNLPEALSDYESRIKTLISEIQNPRSRKEKNRQRVLTIRDLLKRVKAVKNLIAKEARQ